MKAKLIVLSILFILFTTIGGTIAFTYTEQNSSSQFSNENVEIDQIECERIKDESGNYISVTQMDWENYTSSKLKIFTQEQEIAPAYYSNGIVEYDNNQLFASSVKNVIDKLVYVKNTGDTNIYYRTIIAIECPQEFDISLVHLNTNKSNKFIWEDIGYQSINGNRYFIKVATYTDKLIPEELSVPSLLQVFLDPKTSNEDMDLIGNTFEILVKTQAIKVEDGTTPSEALNNTLGYVKNTNPWSNN